MSAVVLDGKALAEKILQSLAPRIQALRKAKGRAVSLAAIAGAGSASAESFLKAERAACRRAGIELSVKPLSAKASPAEALKLVQTLSQDSALDAMIVDLPLPEGLDSEAVLAALPPGKDAEGMSPRNFGRLFMAKTYAGVQSHGIPAPCTALAVAELVRETRTPVSGKHAVVIGRSSILGKPAAHLLSCLDATVTLCHSRTRELESEVRRADIVVACLGRPRFIKGSWLKEGALVIDAGINRQGRALCGDVDFKEASEVASYITPVPGGVGPVTTALLLANTVILAEKGGSG